MAAEYFCVMCKTPFQNAWPLDAQGCCALCRRGLRNFEEAYCFGAYEGVLRQLVHLYKYGRMRPLAAPLGVLLAAALPRDRAFDVVVPVPLHWRRRWERGFNQSELLARATARRCGIPMRDAVRRTRATAVQAGLSNSLRRQNVAGEFRVKRGARVAGMRVLSTGSTASSCAAALKRAGARSVTLLVLARVDRRFGGAHLAGSSQQGAS